jgi:drug/metabolite transporter (DMT)-like permease
MTKNAPSNKEAIVLLHFIVFIWGFTGILGKEITLDSDFLVFWRMVIAASATGLWAFFSKTSLRTYRKELLAFAGIGLFTAAHWICFFESIKVSNVSTALAVLSTTSFFVAIVAPMIRRTAFDWRELFLGIMVIGGLTIIFKFEPDKTWGITLSLCAALFAAVFSSYNSNLVRTHHPIKIAFYEMLFGMGAVAGYLIISSVHPDNLRPITELFVMTGKDVVLLLILGVVATSFAFVKSIDVMKVLSPFTCALTINLEPVYTIAFALFLYGEDEYMSPHFYLGAGLIMITLFIEASLRRRK